MTDLEEINELIRNAIGGIVEFEDRDYNINGKILLYNKNNLIIEGNNARIKIVDNHPVNNSTIFQVSNYKNIKICNLTINGNRPNRNPVGEHTGHSVSIMNSHFVELEGMHIIDSVADGIYIGKFDQSPVEFIPKRITIKNCNVSDSFRNGMSIINGYHINVIESTFKNSNGAGPQAGVDIESDYDNTGIPGSKHITFKKCKFENNNGWGLMFSQMETPRDIIVEECEIRENNGGIKLASIFSIIRGCTIENNTNTGIESIQYNERTKDYNSILGNIISGGSVLIKYHGYGGKILHNICKDSEAGIQLNGNSTNETSVIVASNLISNISDHGIQSNNFDKAKIEDNIIRNCDLNGLELVNGLFVVKGNKTSTVHKGINLVGSKATIMNNNLQTGNIGIEVSGGGTYSPSGILRNNDIQSDIGKDIEMNGYIFED